MRQRRPISWLSILAALSLLPAAVLLSGYFLVAGPTFTAVSGAPVAHSRAVDVHMDQGRIRIWISTVTPPPTGVPKGTSVSWRLRPSVPDVRRSLWEFDNHSLNSVLNMKGATAYIVAFPIWCALLPFLILPLIWWRKRPRPTLAGFPIEPADRSSIADTADATGTVFRG